MRHPLGLSLSGPTIRMTEYTRRKAQPDRGAGYTSSCALFLTGVPHLDDAFCSPTTSLRDPGLPCQGQPEMETGLSGSENSWALPVRDVET